MQVKPVGNQVHIKVRDDLEEAFSPPVKFQQGRPLPRPVYGEVIAIGKGDMLDERPPISPGDIVLWDLSQHGPPVMVDGKPVMLLSWFALMARVEGDNIIPLRGKVLLMRDPEAMQRAFSASVILPPSVISTGIQREVDGPVTIAYERVVAVASKAQLHGKRLCVACKHTINGNLPLELEPGDLAIVNPQRGIEWRRKGVDYRFVNYTEIRGKLE